MRVSLDDYLQGPRTVFRKHQSLGYLTPGRVYRTGIGGEARIVDHFNGGTPNPATSGQRRSAAGDPAPS
ncbi:hypothetical protein [Methylomagnum ishizawai]|uniref:hypothetical protein n=1 Tax=Methylomagnum ishizawai TaxID=1760988 RepID=UPI000F742616|nr:hypothetical protein [Methylomagnum ishizawai]